MDGSKFNIPDISDLPDKAVSCFLARSIGGSIQKKPKNVQGALSVLARLIDKAKMEYLLVREAILEDEKEGKLTYEDLVIRGQGQFFFTVTIINNLENCINTLSRIYKVITIINEEHQSAHKKPVIEIRNSIEHINERIIRDVKGALSLIISGDDLVAEITGQQINFVNLASEIKLNYIVIMQCLQSEESPV